MTKLFGTDGIRGKAGVRPLDKDTVQRIGFALVKVLETRIGRMPELVIGRDTRESGGWLMDAFCSGANAAGANVTSAGIITTPGVAFITADTGADAGIVISASHNPFDDNGLKVFMPSGKKLDEEIECAIEKSIAAGVLGLNAEKAVYEDRSSVFRERYIEHLKRNVTEDVHINGKIIIDCANGAASGFAADVFSGIGDELIIINAEPDGQNINKDCGSLHLDQLSERVIAESAAIGIAFDGDADRALFIDGTGSVIDGDATLWVIAKDLASNGGINNSQVVSTVMSNVGLEIALKSIGAELVRADVGDKYVLEKLLDTNSEIGGEQSGHIIFPRLSLVGDGMATALLLIKAVNNLGADLSEAAAGFERLPQTLVNVRVKSKPDLYSVDQIREAADVLNGKLAGNGRLLLRYSGTENLARVMIEGRDQNEIETYANELAKVITDAIG